MNNSVILQGIDKNEIHLLKKNRNAKERKKNEGAKNAKKKKTHLIKNENAKKNQIEDAHSFRTM